MAHSRSVAVGAILASLAFFSLGFGLDKGELACEEAASHLAECCPDLELGPLGCMQKGGCGRTADGTIVDEDESECLRQQSCEEIVAEDECNRIQHRLDSIVDDGPSVAEIREVDPLCE